MVFHPRRLVRGWGRNFEKERKRSLKEGKEKGEKRASKIPKIGWLTTKIRGCGSKRTRRVDSGRRSMATGLPKITTVSSGGKEPRGVRSSSEGRKGWFGEKYRSHVTESGMWR